MKLDSFKDLFITDARALIERAQQVLVELAEAPERTDLREELGRAVHTLKGNARMVGLTDIADSAHSIEDLIAEGAAVTRLLTELDALRNQLGGNVVETGLSMQAIDGVRVGFEVLDDVLNLVAEMVLQRNRLRHVIEENVKRARREESPEALNWREVGSANHVLNRTLDALRETVLGLRMVPLTNLFEGLKRIVHDANQRSGGSSILHVEGGDTPLDRGLVDVATTALGHLVRNAVVHGIEDPETRNDAMKPPRGTVSVSAHATADEVIIEVSDDGRGINVDALRARARAAGVDVADDRTDVRLVFEAGISTHGLIDVDAGRGMGLSAVVAAVRDVGGHLDVFTHKGVGTRFELHFPLSVLIMRVMLVRLGEEVYAIPLDPVLEDVRVEHEDVQTLNEAWAIRWRKRMVTALDLGWALAASKTPQRRPHALVISGAGVLRALLIDSAIGIREVVVRRLDPIFGRPQGLLGSTLLSDGRPALILDPAQLATFSPFVTSAQAN